MIRKKILICDDDEGILDLLEMLLDDSGFDVVAEQSSLNVNKLIEQEHPDLLILDLWMPVLSGDQVLKMLRSNPDTKSIPVIVISASIEGERIAKLAGANEFLSKPFDVNGLISTIKIFMPDTTIHAAG